MHLFFSHNFFLLASDVDVYFNVQLQDDPEFQEFLEVHKIGDQKKTWANDAVVGQNLRQAESNVDDDGETAEPMEVNSPGQLMRILQDS